MSTTSTLPTSPRKVSRLKTVSTPWWTTTKSSKKSSATSCLKIPSSNSSFSKTPSTYLINSAPHPSHTHLASATGSLYPRGHWRLRQEESFRAGFSRGLCQNDEDRASKEIRPQGIPPGCLPNYAHCRFLSPTCDVLIPRHRYHPRRVRFSKDSSKMSTTSSTPARSQVSSVVKRPISSNKRWPRRPASRKSAMCNPTLSKKSATSCMWSWRFRLWAMTCEIGSVNSQP